jgi:hypothetical protein
MRLMQRMGTVPPALTADCARSEPARDSDSHCMTIHRVSIVVASLALSIACGQEPATGEAAPETVAPSSETGALTGFVCNHHIGEPLRDGTARVLLDDGGLLAATLDDEGYFLLDDIPAGERFVTIQGDGFQRTELIVIAAGAVTELTDDLPCDSTDF